LTWGCAHATHVCKRCKRGVAWFIAKKGRTRLLAEVDERRNLRTNAAVGQLLDRHLEMAETRPEHAWRPNNRLDCYAVTYVPAGDAVVFEVP
jgi:hypothetical protein